MSSYPSLHPVIAKTRISGKITRPGDTVEKMEKNWRMAIAAKKLGGRLGVSHMRGSKQ